MYYINSNLITDDTIVSTNVTASTHREYLEGEVIQAWYGDDQTTLHEYIVLKTKTTSDDSPKLVCIVGGTYNINGLVDDSNTVENINALANRNIFGIEGSM